MTHTETAWQTDERRSLRSRINWPAVFAGVVIALSMQFLLSLLGTAAGISISEKVGAKTLQVGGMFYLALTLIASVFVGGLVSSLLTSGENKQEAILTGFVVWGVTFLSIVLLALAGIQGGANVLFSSPGQSQLIWEDSARQAGVTEAQLGEFRAKNPTLSTQVQDPANQQAALDLAKKTAWYGFFLTWISMLAAAAGAYVGAGPTFRPVWVQQKNVNLREELLRDIPVGSR